jgi:hypothetical protein
MIIGTYSICDYYCVLMVILLITTNIYSIGGYSINGYFINGY